MFTSSDRQQKIWENKYIPIITFAVITSMNVYLLQVWSQVVCNKFTATIQTILWWARVCCGWLCFSFASFYVMYRTCSSCSTKVWPSWRCSTKPKWTSICLFSSWTKNSTGNEKKIRTSGRGGRKQTVPSGEKRNIVENISCNNNLTDHTKMKMLSSACLFCTFSRVDCKCNVILRIKL